MIFCCLSSNPQDCFRIALVCAVSIVITACGILLKASQVDGVILYNKFSVFFFAESFKLAIACGTGMYESAKQSCHAPENPSLQEDGNDYSNMDEAGLKMYRNQKALFDSGGEEPDNVPKVVETRSFPTWKHVLQYSIPGTLFVIVHNVRFSIYEHLNPGVVSVCWNVKIVFVALLLKFFLGRNITLRQWIGISLLIVGGAATELSQVLWHNSDLSMRVEEEDAIDEWEGRSQSDESFKGELEGIALLVFGMLTVAIANVNCEYLFKEGNRTDTPFYKQNMLLYCWGVALNGVLWLAQASSTASAAGGIFDNYTYYTVALIVAEGLSGYLHGAIFKYLDAIAAIFAGVIGMLATSILSAIFYELHITSLFCLGFGLSVVSIYIYFVEKSRIVCHQEEALLVALCEDEEDIIDNCSITKNYDGRVLQENAMA